jgi:hypothetical protein
MWSRSSSHFNVPKGSLPCSQQPAMNNIHAACVLISPLSLIFIIIASFHERQCLPCGLFVVSGSNYSRIFSFPGVLQMHGPYHSFRLEHPNVLSKMTQTAALVTCVRRSAVLISASKTAIVIDVFLIFLQSLQTRNKCV